MVTIGRRLDLDHVGAELGEDEPGGRGARPAGDPPSGRGLAAKRVEAAGVDQLAGQLMADNLLGHAPDLD